MKNTKRRLEPITFYDHTGIERRLEKMLAKGWMLERITALGWLYRRVEGITGRFAVTYYHDASEFDPAPTEGQQQYQEYTARTGWRFVCASGQMQIFVTENEDAPPIETDPVTQVENICRGAKTYLRTYFLLLAIGILNGALFISRLLGDPIGVLASSANLTSGVCWTALLILCASELVGYYRWRGEARRNAERGEFTETRGNARLQLTVLIVVGVVFAYWIVSTLFSGSSILIYACFSMICYMAFLLAAVHGTKNFLKRKNVSRRWNLVITLTVDFVLAFGLMGLIVWGTMQLSNSGAFDKDTKSASIPLDVKDLVSVDYDGYIRENRVSESLFLAVRDVYQRPQKHGDGVPSLEYTVTVVKAPFLYDICKRDRMEKYEAGSSVRRPRGYVYQPIDAAPWGADEAYRLVREKVQPLDIYLLCYEECVVEILLDWEPTAEQMQTVYEKLTER